MTGSPLSPQETTASLPQARPKLPNATVCLFLITLIGILGGLSIDLFFSDHVFSEEDYARFGKIYFLKSLIVEGHPDFGGSYLLKTFLAVLSSICFVVAVIRFQATTGSQTFQEGLTPHTKGQGLSSISNSGTVSHSDTLTKGKELAIWGVLLLSGSFSTVFLYSPRIFLDLSKEDGIIEWLSASMCFLSFVVFGYIFALLQRAKVKQKLLYLFPTAGFALIFFLIGMEEVSWFQRTLSIPTPEGLSGNSQGELNFHNFITGPVENAYYFSAFLFLIILPFVRERTDFIKEFSYLEFFVPSRFIVVASALFVAYNYDQWNIQFLQLSFFVTLFILAYYAWDLRSQGHNFSLPAILFGGLVATQALFLINGHHLGGRIYRVTEYKEFLIPLSFLMYSLEVLKKARQLPYHQRSGIWPTPASPLISPKG